MAENIFRMFGGEKTPKKEFTPRGLDNSSRDNPSANDIRSKLDALRAQGRVNPAQWKPTVDNKNPAASVRGPEKKIEPKKVSAFGLRSSIESNRAGQSFFGNAGIKKHFDNVIGGPDKRRKTGAGMFGKQFYHREDAYKAEQDIINRKFDRIKGLTPEMIHKAKNSSDAARALAKAYGEMLRGQKK